MLALARAFIVWEMSKKFGVEFSISWCSLFKWEGRKKRRKKKLIEGLKKSKVWNSCMEPICIKTICMEFMYGTYMYGNFMYGIIVWKSLFIYVWVRKTLTHNKGVFGWFKFSFEG